MSSPSSSRRSSAAAPSSRGEIATDGNGVWIAAWYREGFGGADRDIVFARSSDAGLTWSAPAGLNTNWATDAGDDGRPRLVADGAGQWVAVWYSEEMLVPPVGPDRDLLFARSCDDGAHWTAPAVLNENAYTDLGARDYGHEVALGANGSVLAAWYTTDNVGGTIGTERDILMARAEIFVCGDADADADFDLYDFSLMQACLGIALTETCVAFDFNADGTIALDDYALLATKLKGPQP